jgi:hypothetical protein
MVKIKKITNMHEFIEAVYQICSNKMNKKEYMSIKQSNKKITENFKLEFAGYYNGKKVYKKVKLNKEN